ncbi:MAG: homoserine dehydrogenase [Desulfobacteraceae bacterium]|nr:homoserine dehydrogenase [Desulfobacteraceae bacterium]
MKPVKLGLIGCGTVGTGVARLLINNRHLIEQRTGIPLHIKFIADLDTKKDRGVAFEPGILISNAWQIIDDPEIDIVIEMIGGETLANDLIKAAIEKGKHIVTANKALLAKHGNQLFKTAACKGVDLAYEASVCGCIPIIKTLRETLVSNQINSMTGIFNGTCNYILTQITEAQISFKDALKQAQAQGYAEADPTLDVEGFDAAHKLAILTSLAYGMHINFDDIYIEGISKITPFDIKLAAEFGYCIKLLAISKNLGDRIEARVHPTMIPYGNILSNVRGTLNAININGHAVDNLFLSGHGAGMMPTASAILSDIVDLSRNLQHHAAARIPLMGCQPPDIQTMPILPITDILTRYYFRFTALDNPGVLSSIAGILGKYEISIQSVHQKGRKTDGSVPIVMMSHSAKESYVRKAFEEIDSLEVVEEPPVLIRIEDGFAQD